MIIVCKRFESPVSPSGDKEQDCLPFLALAVGNLKKGGISSHVSRRRFMLLRGHVDCQIKLHWTSGSGGCTWVRGKKG